MTKLFIILSAVMLVACSPSSNEMHFPVLPEGLKDCRFYKVSDGSTEIKVVRCPNSQTTTTHQVGAKSHTSRSVVVIDGVTYQPE